MTADVLTTRRRAQKFATAAAVAIGALVLFLAIVEEPYHIDELRQVSAYEHGLRTVAELSFGQEQPPLDAVVNSIAQRLLGVGDFQQRLLSVLFGIGSLAFVGVLTIRNGFGWGSPVAVLVLGLSPLLVSVTAYARPYALPLFLILALLLSIDVWLRRPGPVSGVLIPAIAILLPLSRTIEPNLTLAIVAVILILGKYVFRTEWIGSIWIPVASVLGALVLVGAPIIMRLRGDLADYTQSAAMSARAARFVTDLPSALAEVFPWWPVFLLTALVTLAIGRSRRLLLGVWWFWVLAAIPVGFAVVFFFQARLSIPYFSRYAFSWWPSVAVVSGALFGAVFDSSVGADAKSILRTRSERFVALGLVIVIVVGLGRALTRDLTTQGRPDWAAASRAIEQSASDETVIIFEHARPIGAYRPPFYGQPRYLDASRAVLGTGRLLRNPSQIADSDEIGLLLEGSSPDIPGFTPYRVDNYFTLYLPERRLVGSMGAVTALAAVAASLPPDTGSNAALVAATLLASNGDVPMACQLSDSYALLIGERGSRTRGAIDREGEVGFWVDQCSEENGSAP